MLSSYLSADDLSFNVTATHSPVVNDPNHMYMASNALDRNRATCMRTETIGRNSPDKTTWWKVDLGGVYNIFSINILFKNYSSYGMYVCYC